MSNITSFKWPVALLLAILVFLQACSNSVNDTPGVVSGPTMGTSYTVKWFGSHTSEAEVARVKSSIQASLAAVNQSMSTYIADSELSKFNSMAAGSTVKVSDDLFAVLSLSEQISRQSSGAFDVTVGPLVNLWGFGPDGRVIKAPDDTEIARLTSLIGYQKLQLNSASQSVSKTADLYVDLSAIAKGFGVDKLAEVLETFGIHNYLVEIGGEIRAKGVKPENQTWKIAIESPGDAASRSIQQVLSISDTGIATSGDYRNYFEEEGVRYSHTIDPATAKPITHRLASVTVLRETCAEADALATAFMVMGEQKAYDFAVKNNIDAFFIVKSEEGFIEKMTGGFKNRLVK